MKSPLAWAVSMYDSPFHSTVPKAVHANRSLAAFLAAPWTTNYTKSKALQWHESFPSVAALRTAKLRAHTLDGTQPGAPLKAPNFHVLRYEDALADPKGRVEAILARHGLEVARHEFKATQKKLAASGSTGSTAAQFGRRDYYLKGEYLARYDRSAYDAYVPQLDEALEASIGYAPLPSWAEVEAAHRRRDAVEKRKVKEKEKEKEKEGGEEEDAYAAYRSGGGIKLIARLTGEYLHAETPPPDA